MGAEEKSRAFQGGEAEGWHAYAIGPASKSPVAWDEAALTKYLAEGFHPLHGVARGPMAPVVENLARIPREDVTAIAHYIASLSNNTASVAKNDLAGSMMQPKGPGTAPQSAGLQAPTPSASSEPGSRIYTTSCASCHESGRELPLGGMKLAASTAIGGESAENLVNIVLNGLPAAGSSVQPVMPGFAGVLTDAQLEDLVRYLRSSFGQKPVWTNLQEVMRAARGAQRPRRFVNPNQHDGEVSQ
jgi:mono/diheme cytochrome c family protein